MKVNWELSVIKMYDVKERKKSSSEFEYLGVRDSYVAVDECSDDVIHITLVRLGELM